MAEDFGIPHLIEYLTQIGLKIAHVDQEQELIELAFHGSHGQWRMILNMQQHGDVRKLMLIAPHIATITTKRRIECLEALMAVNYRIAMGKFGLDLEDGEVRLEEAIPLANGRLTFEQFNLVFSALMQTVAMYHSLIPRLVYGNITALEAIKACEQDFFKQIEPVAPSAEQGQKAEPVPAEQELNVDEVLAEVARMLEEHDN